MKKEINQHVNLFVPFDLNNIFILGTVLVRHGRNYWWDLVFYLSLYFIQIAGSLPLNYNTSPYPVGILLDPHIPNNLPSDRCSIWPICTSFLTPHYTLGEYLDGGKPMQTLSSDFAIAMKLLISKISIVI